MGLYCSRSKSWSPLKKPSEIRDLQIGRDISGLACWTVQRVSLCRTFDDGKTYLFGMLLIV